MASNLFLAIVLTAISTVMLIQIHPELFAIGLITGLFAIGFWLQVCKRFDKV